MTHRILSLVFTFIILLATAGLGPSTSADDSATQTPAPAGPAQLPLDEAELQTQWTGLDDQQAGQIIRDNLNALVRATHAYYDAKGVLPPAVVPNAAIPAEKRLSGLVLLLPYLRPLAHAHDGKEGLEKTAADPLATMAQTLFKSIDLTKGWDDPANIKAANTIVPFFLAPGSAPFRDQNGYATTHFAFVRGVQGSENGAFPEAGGVTFMGGKAPIADGTSKTLAIGQIQDALGPWTAAGLSTARYVYHPSDRSTAATFGGPLAGACYFATCDGYVFFLDIAKTPARTVYAYTTRAGGEFDGLDPVIRFRDAAEWKGPPQNAQPPKKMSVDKVDAENLKQRVPTR